MTPKDYCAFIICLILIFSSSNFGGLHACSNQNPGDSSYFWEMQAPPDEPNLVEIYGEVTAVTATDITIDTGTRKYQLPVALNAEIYCNGLPAVCIALRPVTPQAFFEAKVLVNQENKAVSIAGVYSGEICVLLSWRIDRENLYLKLSSADSERTCWRMVDPHAKIPKNNWLAEDIEIYVLYNYEQNIRAVFFPD